MKVNIFGVGRSGTKLLQLQSCVALASAHGKCRCSYEPLYWSDRWCKLPSELGVHEHLRLPLFLDPSRETDTDSPLLRALAEADDGAPAVTKFIRGNGRIGLIQELMRPDRTIFVLRPIAEILNSLMHMDFDLLGRGGIHEPEDERLARAVVELDRLAPSRRRLRPAKTVADANAVWWHAMNMWALDHFEQTGVEGERVLLLDFAELKNSPAETLSRLYQFLGTPPPPVDMSGVSASFIRQDSLIHTVGTVTKTVSREGREWELSIEEVGVRPDPNLQGGGYRKREVHESLTANTLYRDMTEEVYERFGRLRGTIEHSTGHEGPERIVVSDRPRLTLFTCPKPFEGHAGVIQHNALRSWCRLEPAPQIILFGAENGTDEIASEIGAVHIPDIDTTPRGTPLIHAMFRQAVEYAAHEILVFVNADIILLNDWLDAVARCRARFPEFLMIGQRHDTELTHTIDFGDKAWEQELRALVERSGTLHGPTGIDYFAFPKQLFPWLPPFVVGRAGWDNWVVYDTIMRGIQVVDATRVTTVVHQNHDYGHVAGGHEEAWHGPEARRNKNLAGPFVGAGKYGFVSNAQWELRENDIRERPEQAVLAQKVRQHTGRQAAAESEITVGPAGQDPAASPRQPLKFLQVHPFYPAALASLYQRNPSLASASFEEQIEAIVKDGFSGIHLFGSYMDRVGYDSKLIVLNNPTSQQAWLKEHGMQPVAGENWLLQAVLAQIETIRPDILYLSEPIGLDSKFVRALSYRPKLVVGWRAANVPDGTDWSEFDIILSNLRGMLQLAIELGAKAAEHFFPGFPEWVADEIAEVRPEADVVFCGQVSFAQHVRRNRYLDHVAHASARRGEQFTCRYYLSGDEKAITPMMAAVNVGPRYGIHMHRALRTGRIGLDARGSIGVVDGAGRASIDLARKETSNMRIFETTGSGVFLLTEHHENLSRYFEPGVEVETFTDENDLVDKIRYYVAHPDEREEIARRGQERCLRDYSMTRRCEAFDAIIKKRLPARRPGGASTRPPEVTTRDGGDEDDNAQVVREAFERLNAHDDAEALARLEAGIAGLTYAKAVALARLDRTTDASAALQGVVDSFPGHAKAKALLEELAGAEDNCAAGAAAPPPSTVRPPDSSRSPESAESLMHQATAHLNGGNYGEAFALLNRAKALRQPVEGLDMARAAVFVKAKQVLPAREALLEELRFFPHNEAAGKLLAKVEELTKPLLETSLGDDEFKELYRTIRPHTMLHEHRLFSLYTLAKRACEEDVPGNFVECGVAAGGGSALLAAVMKRHGKRERLHFALDTFEGMPDPTAEDIAVGGVAANDTGWGAGTCAAPRESLEAVCDKLGVRDLVRPIKGTFQETLAKHKEEIGEIALLHLDADWYESTRTVLNELYDRIADDGYVQFDDYGGWSGCRKAIDEFQMQRSLSFDLQYIDGTGVWMAKRGVRGGCK